MKASEKAYQALLDDIVEGALPAGSVLAEVEQAERLGISRTPLREALYRLHSDGLLTTPSGRGATVTALSAEGAIQLYAVRRALEELGATLAARSTSTDLFYPLEREFQVASRELTAESSVIASYYQLNARFDHAIDQASGNDYLRSALGTVRKHASRFRQIARNDLARLKSSASETALICQAIIRGDGELAAHATHIHLDNSLQHILSTFPPSTESTS